MEYKDINDYELLYLISDIQDDEVVYLLSKYEPFIQKKCNKWKMVLDKLGIEIEDLQQEIRIVFLEAIKNFKEEKNTVFYTYVSRIIDAKIKSLVRRMNSNKNIISSSCVSSPDFGASKTPATAPNVAPTAKPAKNLITDIYFSPSFVV